MSVVIYEDRIVLKTKEDVLKAHLLLKFHEKDIKLSMADINTIIELYKYGYTKQFFKSCIENKIFKSKQTVRNAISRLTTLGILTCQKRGERAINQEYLLETETDVDTIIIKYLVRNA